MDYITAILIVGFVVLGIYKLVELFVKRKERMFLIEKLAFVSEDEEDKEKQLKIRIPFLSDGNFDFGFWPLRISLLLIGIGAGCLLAFVIQINTDVQSYRDWNLITLVNFASISMFGGIGLLIAFLIEQKMKAGKK